MKLKSNTFCPLNLTLWGIALLLGLAFGVPCCVIRQLDRFYAEPTNAGDWKTNILIVSNTFVEEPTFVVFNGVTNKYESVTQAMSSAPSGAVIYPAPGSHLIDPKP